MFFKKEDKRNSYRIDYNLEIHRANLKGDRDEENVKCSMHNSSLENAFAGECTKCMMIKFNMNMGPVNIPSLDDVLEETKF